MDHAGMLPPVSAEMPVLRSAGFHGGDACFVVVQALGVYSDAVGEDFHVVPKLFGDNFVIAPSAPPGRTI
jgi:hypothetical protein